MINEKTIQLKKKSWNDVTINEYYEILDILDERETETEQNVGVLAIMCECDEDDVWNLSVPQARALLDKLDWLKKFDFNKNFNSKHVKVAGKEYDVCIDMQEMSIAQYIDFQTFWRKKDLRNYYGNILACFLVPKGYKYGDGYDVAALAKEFNDTISIAFANAVCFFFLKQLAISIKATQVFLDWMMKKMKKKAPTEEIQRKISEMQMLLQKQKSNLDGYLW